MKMKKAIVTLLCVVVATCFMPVAAFASVPSTVTGVSITQGTSTVSFSWNSTFKKLYFKVPAKSVSLNTIAAFKGGSMKLVCGSQSATYSLSKATTSGTKKLVTATTSSSAADNVWKAINYRLGWSTYTGNHAKNVKSGAYVKKAATSSTAKVKIPAGSSVSFDNGGKFTLSSKYNAYITVSGLSTSVAVNRTSAEMMSGTVIDYASLANQFAKAANGRKITVTVTYHMTDAYRDGLGAVVQKMYTKSLKATRYTGKAKLSWSISSSSPSMTAYRIYRASSKGGTYKYVKTTTSKSAYVSTKGLKKGKTYYYKVRGYKTYDGQSYYTHYSNIAGASVR